MSVSKYQGSGAATGKGGGRNAAPSSALAGTQSMTATQLVVGSGQSLNRWPVPPGYKPPSDEAFRRSSQELFSRTTKTGANIGIGVALIGCLLMGLGFAVFGVKGGAVAALCLMVLEVVLSLAFAPRLFEKLNEAQEVKLHRDAETYILGYFYGFAMGNMMGVALVFPAVLFFCK